MAIRPLANMPPSRFALLLDFGKLSSTTNRGLSMAETSGGPLSPPGRVPEWLVCLVRNISSDRSANVNGSLNEPPFRDASSGRLRQVLQLHHPGPQRQ